MTDAAKATVWSATWTPWGEAHSLTGSAINNLRFPGQYFLIETGHAYNWHRTYDPVSGRYTQPDPLRFVDGPSVYNYAKNSPLILTDPKGLVAYPNSPKPPRVSNGGTQMCSADCDANFEIDLATCRGLSRLRGKRAGALCYASAHERYANCLAGRPIGPLNTWNI
jgi:RHS repeat-associated protein